MFPLLALFLGLGPYSAASNFSVDLMGVADTRTSTWGNAAAYTWNMPFHPPAGYRVRILRLRGDLVAWPKVLPGGTPAPAGMVSGVLLAFATTAPGGSSRCDYCSDGCMLYIQDALGALPVRAAYDQDTSAGGLLEPDNILNVTVSSWLNVTGKYIHLEPTFVVTYRFEPAQ